MSIEDLYNEIIGKNTVTLDNRWINPRLQTLNQKKHKGYFNIHLDSFQHIDSSVNVIVYAIRNYGDYICIFCHENKTIQ